MMKNINLPFTNQSGGNKNSFYIMNENEINNKMKKKDVIHFIKNMLFKNNLNNTKNLNYIKASSTKKYYENIKTKKQK
jgi:TPP-dependent pyruvate/acetoin dehydrogenase alpha subunit